MKGSPVPLTQDEVDALTNGGKAAASARRRLRSAKPTKLTSSRQASSKMAPQPISRKEMSAIQAGRVPADVRRRIVAASKATTVVDSVASEKAAPSITPRRYAEPTPKKK